jgi:hypothetical protein
MIYFTKQRIITFRDILNDVGQVFFASILIEPVIGQKSSPQLIIAGAILSLACWYISLYLTK